MLQLASGQAVSQCPHIYSPLSCITHPNMAVIEENLKVPLYNVHITLRALLFHTQIQQTVAAALPVASKLILFGALKLAMLTLAL